MKFIGQLWKKIFIGQFGVYTYETTYSIDIEYIYITKYIFIESSGIETRNINILSMILSEKATYFLYVYTYLFRR